MSEMITVLEENSWWNLTPMRRVMLRDWMRANDIPADLLPIQEPIKVVGDRIHYTEIVLDEDRQPIYRDGLVTCQEVDAPLKKAVPEDLPDTFSA